MFIVFEGCDGTGKTTHSKKLFNELKMDNVEFISFPDRNTVIGKILDNYLKNNSSINPRVSHLLFSANRGESYDVLNRAVNNKGVIIISDRYYFSGVVYTKTLDHSIPIKWLENVDKGLPEPDLVLYLYNEENFFLKKEIYETKNFQRGVKRNYEDIYLSKKDNWIPIDTSRPKMEVFKKILNTVEYFINEKND